jgi:predicted dehydrogenase
MAGDRLALREGTFALEQAGYHRDKPMTGATAAPTDPVRVAVVGVAGMGQAHLFAISSLPDEYQLTGVCDVDAEAAKKAASDWKTSCYTTLDELLASDVAEAVVVATPPFQHGPITRSALESGRHVYCEKPMVPTVKEGLELAAAADRAGRTLQVGLQYRFRPSYERAAALVASGAIGDVFRANLTATSWFRPDRYFRSRPWRGRWRTVGGGALLHHSIHQLDAYLGMLGQPVRVTAQAFRTIHDIEVEDEVTAMLEFADGCRGVVAVSTADPVGANRIEIHGEAGTIVAEGDSLRRASFAGSPVRVLSASCEDDFPAIRPEWTEEVATTGSEELDSLLRCHRDFVAAVRSGDPPRNHPVAALAAIAVANAVYLSAVRQQSVDLPLDPDEYQACYEDLCEGRVSLRRLER